MIKRNSNKYRLLSMLFVVTILLSTFSCGEKKLEPLHIDPAFAEYVMSFTSGVISTKGTVRVRLVQEIPNAVPGKELDFNPFSFSPSIKGKAVWYDTQTIEFIPSELLPSGTIYEAEFALHKFVQVPENLEVLPFRFQVMKQGVEYQFNGMEPYVETDKQWQKVKGKYITADYVESSAFAASVTASSKNKTYTLTWSHSADGRIHEFVIDSVERINKAFTIDIECDAKDFGVDKNREDVFEMPSLQDFKVIHVRANTAPSTSVEIFFSDPIQKTQDINGLVSLQPTSEERLSIDGNVIRMFFGSSVTGDVTLTCYAGILNVFGEKLPRNYVKKLHFVSLKPEVKFVDNGSIIPNSNGIRLPFSAVSLKAVDIKVIQIFENNIPQFLQVNQLDGSEELKRVGRVVYSGEMQLVGKQPLDYSKWNNFMLDLTSLVQTQPGAIYRVEISFKKKHSLYACGESDSTDTNEETYVSLEEENQTYDSPNSYWDYYDEYDYDYENYNWYDRDNPCKPSYYMYNNKKVSRNVLASDMGIIAKAGTNSEYFVTITDLRSTDPMVDIDVEFRNYQNQLIAKSKTNADGMCRLKLDKKPYLLIAKQGTQRGYLRIDEGSSLSVSMFDVQGEELKKGLKGFIYGERGVWRPGDSLFLTFILADKNMVLPKHHPVVLELYTPENQLSQRIVRTANVNGFYSFHIQTASEAPTGNWLAKVKVGSSTFSKTIRIETVKPNRMKINLTYASEIIKKDVPAVGKLQVNWLHGSPARNAKVNIQATIAPQTTEFKGYTGYIFDDPSKSFTSEEFNVFDGILNDNGYADVPTKIDIDKNTPGMIAVQLKTHAFESGGDFSVDRFVMKYSPYSAYAGVRIPEGTGWNKALLSDKTNLIPIVSVSENGKPLSKKLKVEIFNIYWRWWWDMSAEDNIADYITNQHQNLLVTDYVTTKNGKAIYSMNLGQQSWGRKYIRVTDEESGHSTGATFYTTYDGWWSNAGNDNPGGAEMLLFNTNKESYKVGENVEVTLPVSHKGKALVSIETGSKVLQNFWVKDSKFSFKVTPDMAPNMYIHVSYIQPYNHKGNDFPIRMYGVKSVKVEDPETHLVPLITMPKVLRPEQKFAVKVREAKGKPMTYTIAIVDEGLLDLTRFQTPNPWKSFYSHEALGVRTWDLYKYVAGAFNGQIAGLLAIGGDEYLNRKGKEDNNRFKPVVLFKGPYTCKAGETQTIQFTMPNYVGSVKVMVVAGGNNAYGSAEQVAPVKQDLMVLPTLPRVVSPTEQFKIPVTVFAMNPKVKQVTVKLNTDKNIEVLKGATQTITFNKIGEQTIEFDVRVKEVVGFSKIFVTAQSGAVSAKSETTLQIRLPNPPIQNVISAVLKPGQTITKQVQAVGISGTNTGIIELSTLFPLNIENRLQYLIQYPHGCIEQITSAAFPQLYLNSVLDLTKERKAIVESNVKACLSRLKSYQMSSGGFAYWPGESYGENEWGTNYAGHFLLEARKLGYQLPVGVLENWLTYQTNAANNWQLVAQYGVDEVQAYRLFTLALAGKPALSAMNRFRETSKISVEAKWRLAAAYVMAGKPEIAKQIIKGIESVKPTNVYYNYGSYERNKAMMLETLLLLKNTTNAKQFADELSRTLSSGAWLSTQTTAYMLLSLTKFVGYQAQSKSIQCVLKVNGTPVKVNSTKSLYQYQLPFHQQKTHAISITNTSKSVQYLRIQLRGIPLINTTNNQSENVQMTIAYYDQKGKVINPSRLKQGTNFYAEVSITHPGFRSSYKDMAVQHMLPSGWEIHNTRLDEIETSTATKQSVRYQDIRDDRVLTYFDLAPNETKKYRLLLHAAYLGKFFLPSVQCEAMYDNTIRAISKGQWVEVYK